MNASKFLLKLKSINKEKLLEIKGIGTVLADNFVEFTDSERFQKLINQFQILENQNKGLEVNLKAKQTKQKLVLGSEIICITGTFETGREEIKKKLEDLGAKIVNSISKTTTILLCGDNAGSKLEKAQEFGTKIVYNLDQIL